ncbi:MAG: C25 family cysteine peptidase [Chthoniobacteraceae bacterium]
MRGLLPALVALLLLTTHVKAADFLVIAPRAFAPALEEFIAYKNTRLPTQLVILEEVLATTDGIDDAEKVKRFLHEKWLSGKCAYALLAGDADVFPVRYMVLDRITPEAFDYAFYPSDHYYADLAKADGAFDDWNAQREGFHAGYFGEVRGEKNKGEPINYDAIDYQPEIAIGRWAVSTSKAVRAVAAKTIAVEKARAAKSDADRKAALIGATGWIDTDPHFDRVEKTLASAWTIERRLFQKQTKARENKEPLLALWNAGHDLILHAGHGNPWDWEQCFTLKELPQLQNPARVPIVFSAGCSTAYFAALAPYDGYVDVNGAEHTGTYKGQVFTAPPPPPANYQRGGFNKTGLGEELVRMPTGGAVAYIGCNTGSQPCGLTLQRGFVAAAAIPGIRLGDAWIEAMRYYQEKERLAELKPDDGWYPPSIFFQGMKFMVFGDPTVEL